MDRHGAIHLISPWHLRKESRCLVHGGRIANEKAAASVEALRKKGAFIHRRADPFRAERLRVKAAVFLFALHGEGPPKATTPRNKSRTLSLGQTSGFVVYT